VLPLLRPWPNAKSSRRSFLIAAAVLAIDVPQYVSGDHTVFRRLPWWIQSPLYAALCVVMILFGGLEVPFIYFQF
jgi:hypothetical protein